MSLHTEREIDSNPSFDPECGQHVIGSTCSVWLRGLKYFWVPCLDSPITTSHTFNNPLIRRIKKKYIYGVISQIEQVIVLLKLCNFKVIAHQK